MTVTIGSAGTSVTAANTAGVAGGFSKFEPLSMTTPFSPDVVGNGGAGGVTSGWGVGSTGGTGTGGDINIQGSRGWMGGDGSAVGISFLGTPGASTSYAGGTDIQAYGYGAGGGGGYSQNSGAGSIGIVILYEYQ